MFLHKIENKIRVIYKRLTLKRDNVILHRSAIIDHDSEFEGDSKIGENCIIINSKIGRGTYLASGVSIFHSKIGRFCSIAPDVTCVIGNHPTSTFVSTHPAFFSTLKQAGFTFCNSPKFNEFKYVDKKMKYMFEIGNDVWIGQNVKLVNGVKIGDGCVIAAGSVVTKDVPNYSIVGGIPAKVIKSRFSDDQIEKLEEIKWWNRSMKWLNTNAYLFEDISFLLNEKK